MAWAEALAGLKSIHMKWLKNPLLLRSRLLLGSLLIIAATASIPAQQSDLFYVGLLEKAQKSFLAKNYEEAARSFEVALFGLAGDRTRQSKALVYLSLCKYYLKDLKASESNLREAAALMGEEGFGSLQIYQSAWPDVEKLMNFYNIGQAQNSPLPREVSKPETAIPENPGAKADLPPAKPGDKAGDSPGGQSGGSPQSSETEQPAQVARNPQKAGLKINEIKEGDIIPLDLVETPPVVIRRVRAAYPSYASASTIEGTVIVNALVSEKGDVIKTEIIKDMEDAFGFKQAAQSAVRQWKFEPASIKGIRVKVWIPVAIDFKKETSQ